MPAFAARTAMLCALYLATASHASASDDWSLHGQATFTAQYKPAFAARYSGQNSLDPKQSAEETIDTTLFAGVRLWDGGEAYFNPEIDQGFGLSNTLGVAGFPSGEAYKVGASAPYLRLQRLFFRQSFQLGGDQEAVEDGPNQVAGSRSANSLVITAGKFPVTDIFDANSYAHDPRRDFLNWSIIDSGAFDYAADAWGYSYGLVGEWNQDWWSWRIGLFNLSRIPNSTELVRGFGQYELVSEVELRHTQFGQPGKVKLLAYFNRGRMGSYDDAVGLAFATHTVPDTALVRRAAIKPGVVLNVEQGLADGLGGFLRFSVNDGGEEAYEFTEINSAVAAGVSLSGARWERPDDTIGLAFAHNALSRAGQRYLAAGGMGILIGDGRLNYGTENIAETYYSARLTGWFTGSVDYQLILNPAYNRDRGPVSVLSLRLHSEF